MPPQSPINERPPVYSAADRRYVTALARGLDLLRCFAPGDQWLGNIDIARRTGLPKATVARLAYTLCALGYLEYSAERSKYALGIGVLSLGFSMLANLDVRRMARPAMQRLAEHAQASVSLGVRERLDMVYVENCRAQAPLALGIGVGARLPVATSSMGLAWLCGLDEAQRESVLGEIRQSERSRWPKLRTGIEQAVAQYRDLGFVTSIGQWEPDINAVGCPLVIGQGLVVMSFNCGGPATRLTPQRLLNDIGPRLATMVAEVRSAIEGAGTARPR